MAADANAVPLHIFDDGRGRFGPLTDRRPAFLLRCGIVTNRVRIERAMGREADGLHLDALLAEAMPPERAAINPSLAGAADVLLVSGRWTGHGEVAASVRDLPPRTLLVEPGGDVLAARLPGREAQRLLTAGEADGEVHALERRVLLARPWHILDALPELLPADLASAGGVDPGASVHATAVLDDSRGPVGVAAGAVIGPLAVIEGPVWVGPGSTVHAHAHLRPNTVISEVCKVGGEIGGSILYPYSNKGHAGYLGDSIVGAWCNFGAGTTVSNLKNTYGEVRVQLDADAPAQPTARQFHGPILGDFVRTAIGTRLLTGSCLGTACCVAVSGFAPKFVRPFSFLTDDGAQPYDFDAFIEHARTAMSRRKQTLSPADLAVLQRIAHGSMASP